MNTHTAIFRYCVCLVCLLFAVVACEKEQPAPSPAKGKIKMPVPAGQPAAAKKPATPPPPAKKPQTETAAVVEEEEEEDLALPASLSGLILLDRAPDGTISYSSEGRIDPFEPLFQEEPEGPAETPVVAQELCPAPSTPLEKLELSQLRLVAVIRSAAGNRALVEDPAGKGFVIDKGLRVGPHCGQVVMILKDRLVVEERRQDIYGNIKTEKKELKLPLPGGER